MTDLITAADNRAKIAEIKRQYDLGLINRETAKELAQPILGRINDRTAEIYKKHGKKNYPKLDFINAMRNSY